MNEIEIRNPSGYAVDSQRLQQAIATTLAHQDQTTSALTVLLTGDDEVQRLNAQYRDVDAPTDVLSFPAGPLPPGVAADAPYLGDLILAVPYATRQANRLGHELRDSLALLVIHGTLHLLGYTHDTLSNRRTMWAAQEAILEQLQIDSSIVPTLENEDHA